MKEKMKELDNNPLGIEFIETTEEEKKTPKVKFQTSFLSFSLGLGVYMQIEINNKIYDVEIIKKNNRNTYVRVKNGKIVVTTNYLVSKKEIIK